MVLNLCCVVVPTFVDTEVALKRTFISIHLDVPNDSVEYQRELEF